MLMSCKLKRLGHSLYIVVNPVVLDSLNVLENDVILVDFKEKVENMGVSDGQN